jgi:hypothetical protein
MRKYLIAIALLGGLGLFMPDTASADLLIRLSDGVNPDVIVLDNAGAAVASTGGNVSTHADINPLAGVVTFSGNIGNFIVNVTTGLSKPVIGQRLDLNSVQVTSGAGGGTMTLQVTDTGFTLSPGGLKLALGGTTDGSVSFSGAGDAGNAEFGAGPGPALGPFGPGAFSGTVIAAGAGTAPYSMTLTAVIVHGTGDSTSFDAELSPVPEPSSLVLVATGLTFFGGTFWRRRRKAAA